MLPVSLELDARPSCELSFTSCTVNESDQPEADIASRAAVSQRLKAFAASSRAHAPGNEADIGAADDAVAVTAAVEGEGAIHTAGPPICASTRRERLLLEGAICVLSPTGAVGAFFVDGW